MKKRVIFKVHGDVQGINFRYYAMEEAQKLDIAGWVRNDSQGTVSILAEGEEENLKKLIDWAYKGPTLARVDKVDVSWKNYKGEFDRFEVRY